MVRPRKCGRSHPGKHRRIRGNRSWPQADIQLGIDEQLSGVKKLIDWVLVMVGIVALEWSLWPLKTELKLLLRAS